MVGRSDLIHAGNASEIICGSGGGKLHCLLYQMLRLADPGVLNSSIGTTSVVTVQFVLLSLVAPGASRGVPGVNFLVDSGGWPQSC